MSSIFFIHLLAIGIWAGCVATEVVCEFDQEYTKFQDSYIASLHWKIDKFIELPAIFITCLTGFIMLEAVTWTLLITIKIVSGLLAVLLNTIASYTVYKRYKYFSQNNERQYLRHHKQLHGFQRFC